MAIFDKLFPEPPDLFFTDIFKFHSRIQQSIYGLLRSKVTFHKSEKLKVECVFWSKITHDALTELSSLEIILHIPRQYLEVVLILLPGNKLVFIFLWKIRDN